MIAEAEQERGITTLVFTGIGKSFINGADISCMQEMTAAEGAEYSANTTALYEQMERSRKVMIAAVNGFALGAGTEFALACDIRLAGSEARFGFPEVKLGIIPGGGGTQKLPRLIGMGKAAELIFTGKIIRASEAAAFGIVNREVPQNELVEEALKVAEQIAAVSPTAVGYAKECLQKAYSLGAEDGIRYERNCFGLCFAGPEQREGMTAFLEKREARF